MFFLHKRVQTWEETFKKTRENGLGFDYYTTNDKYTKLFKK